MGTPTTWSSRPTTPSRSSCCARRTAGWSRWTGQSSTGCCRCWRRTTRRGEADEAPRGPGGPAGGLRLRRQPRLRLVHQPDQPADVVQLAEDRVPYQPGRELRPDLQRPGGEGPDPQSRGVPVLPALPGQGGAAAGRRLHPGPEHEHAPDHRRAGPGEGGAALRHADAGPDAEANGAERDHRGPRHGGLVRRRGRRHDVAVRPEQAGPADRRGQAEGHAVQHVPAPGAAGRADLEPGPGEHQRVRHAPEDELPLLLRGREQDHALRHDVRGAPAPAAAVRTGPGLMARVVLLGHGISYSASPAMHTAAFRAAGLDWTYELADVPPERLPAAVAALREPEAGGANVTIPHKIAVMPLLDELEGDAVAVGAVNTIRRDGDRLVGSNTDVTGVRVALGAAGVEPAGAHVVVLGVGGSARAAGVALRGA